MAQVVTLGEAMLRLSSKGGVRLRSAEYLDLHVAGSEANVAAALSSLGGEAAWISALPVGPLGDRIIGEMSAAGVDVTGVERVEDGRVGLFFVEFGAPPRPTAVWYDRADSAFSLLRQIPSLTGRPGMALTSGITLALSEPTRELALDFLRSAKERGASACFDVNYRERLWSTGEARDGIMPALEIADVVVCSRADADRVLGVNAPDVVDVARRMLADFAPAASVLVITDGAEGSAGISGSETFRQEAIRAEVIDRIGAGDAFMAGLLWGLLRDEGLDRALEFAAAMGALACTVRGDHALFDEEEVRAVARAGTTELVR